MGQTETFNNKYGGPQRNQQSFSGSELQVI